MPEYGGNILLPQGFRNYEAAGQVAGFQVRVVISYYRGVPYSLIGGFTVVVDGIAYGPEMISFSVDGVDFIPLAELGSRTGDVWEFGVRAYLRVRKDGGLSRGMHDVTVVERVDVPYLPFTTENAQTRRLALADKGRDSRIRLGVSLYSYQIEYLTHAMSLEECIEAVSDMGADGVEIIPQSMIPGCFAHDEAFLRQWFSWMGRYGTKPIAIDAFNEENKLFAKLGRKATFEETVEIQKGYIDLAHRLGCRYIRTQSTDEALLDVLVPYAERRDVILGREIHAPQSIRSEMVERIVSYVQRTGTRHLGLIPDFGIWQRKAPPTVLEMHIRDGASRALVELAQELDAKGQGLDAVTAEIRARGGNPHDLAAVRRICTNRYDDPELLRGILPYVCGFHGKFWEVGEDLRESCIDYENPLRILVEEGFSGYINSEYEGNRHIQDLGPVPGVEQVRRQHAMIRTLVEGFEEERGSR